MNDLQPAPNYNLGPTLSEHRVTNKRIKGNYYIGIFIAICGVIGLIIAAFISSSEADSGLFFVCGGLSFLLIPAGVYSVWQSRSEQSVAILTFQDGIVYTHGGKTETMRWDEVDKVYMGILNNRQARTIQYTYHLHNEQGGKLVFNWNDQAMQNMQQLSDTIQREITRRLLPKAATTYNAGGTVTFGSLTLGKQGLGNGKETIPWDEVQEVKLNSGIVTVRKKDKWLNWSSVTVAGTPNIYVFLNLVDQIVGINRPK